MNLRHLAAELGDEQPFYGLQYRGADGQLPPHRRMRDMAEEFLRDIRSVQPRGPYYLGGYSAGGLAAYEMAQLLQQSGESVGLVILFDTMNPRLPPGTSPNALGVTSRTFAEKGSATCRTASSRACARSGPAACGACAPSSPSEIPSRTGTKPFGRPERRRSVTTTPHLTRVTCSCSARIPTSRHRAASGCARTNRTAGEIW